MWRPIVSLVILSGSALGFSPVALPSFRKSAQQLLSTPRSKALVPQSSFFSDFDPFFRTPFRLRPGTLVQVKDLGVPGVVLNSQEDGSYLLQVPGRPTPVLIRRRPEDLQMESPSRQSGPPQSMTPTQFQTRQRQPAPQPFAQPPRYTQVEEEEDEEEEPSQGSYRLYRDPRTGRVFAAYERPKLPPETSTGRRIRIAPPREMLNQQQPGSYYGTPKRRLPGYEFVEDTLEKALRQQPRQQGGMPMDVLKQLARGHMLNDEYGKAQQRLSDAYARDGSRFDDEMLNDLAETQHRQGRLGEANRLYQQALKQNEKNSRAALQYAINLHDQGQVVQAMQYYQRAIELDSGNVQAYNNLGVAMQELGQPETALACYRKALEIDGLNEPALQNLAALTVNNGRLRLAAECVKRALLLSPENKTAQRLASEIMQRISAGRTYPLLPGGLKYSSIRGRGGQAAQQQEEEEDEEDEEEMQAGLRGQRQPAADTMAGVRRGQPTPARQQQAVEEEDDGEAEEEEEGYGDTLNKYMSWQDVLEEAWRRKEEETARAAAEQEEKRKAEQEKRQAEFEAAQRRREEAERAIRELNMQQQQQQKRQEAERLQVQQAMRQMELEKQQQMQQQQMQQQMQQQQQQQQQQRRVEAQEAPIPPRQARSQQPQQPKQQSKQQAYDPFAAYRANAGDEEAQEASSSKAPWSAPFSQAGREAIKQEVEPRDAEALQRQRLQAAADAWQELQRAAWAQAPQRETIAAQARERMKQEEQLRKAEEEARQRQRAEQERAERQAKERQAMLELEAAKAKEAARMAEAVKQRTREEAERLKQQVEEDRARAVKQAWEEQLRSQLEEEEAVKQDLARRRMDAVRQAVDSERHLLEKQRQEAELQERIVKERDYASFLMDEGEVLKRQQEWQEWRRQERERQQQAWAERERALNEKRRRVQAGLGIDQDPRMPSAAVVEPLDGLQMEEEDEVRRPEIMGEEDEASGPSAFPLTKAEVPFMITRDMRRTLVEDMNYSLRDVNSMRPEVAVDLIKRGIKKPPKKHRVFTPEEGRAGEAPQIERSEA